MNDSITTDGVSRITNSTVGYGLGYGQALNGILDTQNAWRVDSLGAHRTSDVISAIGDNHVAIEKIGMSGLLATEKTSAAVALAVEKTAMTNHIAESLAFANTQNLLISGFKDGRFDAATNTAAMQAAMAQCCCDIKSLISEDGGKTRELINSLESLHHAVELAEVKLELALAKQHGNGGE